MLNNNTRNTIMTPTQTSIKLDRSRVIEDYSIHDVPDLPASISIENSSLLVPEGYSNILTSSFDMDSETLNLEFSLAEEGNSTVKISSRIFAPETRSNIFPKFVLQISSLVSQRINYDDYPGLILNQNKILWLLIKHRLMQYENQNVHYTQLLRSDISKLASYGEYDRYRSHNAKLKSQNYIVIISPWTVDKKDGGQYANDNDSLMLKMTDPLGEYLISEDTKSTANKTLLDSIFRDLPIQPASESMASKSNKFVMYPHDKPFYSCAGYNTMMAQYNGIKYPVIRTIYQDKPNLPSRIKTHVIADCFGFVKPSELIFKEDIDNSSNGETDGTIMNALVVFDEMNDSTGRLLCGEIESSKRFADSVIFKDEIIKDQFELLFVTEGEDVVRTKNRFILGMNSEGEEIAIYNALSVKILSITDIGYGDAYKIVVRCHARTGSGRILSTTGLKGMTKPKPTLGTVQLIGQNNEPILNEDGFVLEANVDLVCGMNSVKAKRNTIFLARASLAYLIDEVDGPLVSMNEAQINNAADKIQKCLWTDENGNEKYVWCGVVQIRTNELSYMFNNVKRQKFMAESGRFLKDNGYSDVFDKIWEIGVDEDIKDVVIELQKILVDDTGKFAEIDRLPVYQPDNLYRGVDGVFPFDISDCQFDLQPMFPYTSKLLDENYNSGWYLDLRHRNGGVTRMPSAKLLNTLTRQLPDGTISYPVIFRNLSRILKICLEPNANGMLNTGYLNDKNHDRTYGSKAQIARYLQVVTGMIYKRKDMVSSHNKLIEVFMKPQLPGVGMKQMTDAIIPQGVVVILDNRTYGKLSKHTGGFFDQEGFFNALCIRNPVIWKGQIQSFKVWNRDLFELHLEAIYGIKLNDYLVVKYCREVLLMNPEDAIQQQSDVDGDLMPLITIDDMEIQKRLMNINSFDPNNSSCGGINGILPEEMEWNQDYRKGELEANEDLNLDNQKYTLYSIALHNTPKNSSTYSRYFKDSIIAKGDVGPATTQLWALNTLIEVYRDQCSQGLVIGPKGEIVKISEKSITYFLYAWTRLIQDFVIRGIKHISGGSSGFHQFMLDKLESGNQTSTIKILRDQIKMPKNVINDLYVMIYWMNNGGYLTSIRKYIAMFNSGTTLNNANMEHIEMIRKYSFYGNLMSDMRDIELIVEGKKPSDNYGNSMSDLVAEDTPLSNFNTGSSIQFGNHKAGF